MYGDKTRVISFTR